jgi:hypothetical protein
VVGGSGLSWSSVTTTKARWLVLAVALLALGLKLALIFTTFGTEDIRTWTTFAAGVKARGPVGVYGIDFTPIHHGLYNHPPLIGYYLQLINALASIGVPLKVTLRLVSSVADVISALLLFEILRRRQSLKVATIGAAAMAASPLLVLVSGYHGNTDPLFVMFVLLGGFLIVDRNATVGGGIALGLAIGVKIVPIVVLPALAVYLLCRQRSQFVRAFLAFLVTTAVIWGPAAVAQFGPVRHHVLGYVGISARPWGLVQVADDMHWAPISTFLVGPGRVLALAISALLPAVLVWRRPERAMEGVALSLVMFLALSPAFGVQYLAWAVAAAYLLDIVFATVYSVLGGLVLFQIYDSWNNGWPWTHIALGQIFTGPQLALAALLWAALLVVAVKGIAVTARPISHAGSVGAAGGDAPRALSNVKSSTPMKRQPSM